MTVAPKIFRVGSLVLPVLIAAIGVSIVGLSADITSFYNTGGHNMYLIPLDFEYTNSSAPNQHTHEEFLINWKPVESTNRQTVTVLALAVILIVTSLITIPLTIPKHRSRLLEIFALTFHALNFILATALCIYALRPAPGVLPGFFNADFLMSHISDPFNLTPSWPVRYFDSGEQYVFDTTVWNCVIYPFIASKTPEARRVHQLCGEGHAAMKLTIPLVVLSILALGAHVLVWWSTPKTNLRVQEVAEGFDEHRTEEEE